MGSRVGWACLVLAACSTPAQAPRPASLAATVVAASVEPSPEPEVATPEPDVLAPTLPPTIRVPVEVERAIDEAALGAIDRHAIPGAVIAIGRHDGLVFLRSYGARAIEPERERNDTETIYDLASITKVVATTTALAILESRGALSYDAPVARYLPAFAAHGKGAVTIRQLLTHTGGLPPVDPLSAYDGATREESIARILAIEPATRPGTEVVYSDLGMIVLGEVVAAVAGEPLDRFVTREVLTPLSMTSSGYRPDTSLLSRIAPTERAERRGGALIRGEVHDPRAFRLGGISGNAGMFASAPDLARFARAMLRGGELDGVRILPEASVRALTETEPSLGWQMRDEAELRAFRATHGGAMSASSYGHSGWTGTWMRIDPALGVFAVVLSNDVHPDAHGDVHSLTRAIEVITARAAPQLLPPPSRDVRAGIDVELGAGLPTLAGAHAVLVTHDAARTRDGARTLDVLARSTSLSLLRVLAPEHGLASDREGRIRDGRDARTSIPVLGLFGATRRPSDAMLEGADTVVIDLVDVGARFYTYASTMHEVLVAAAARPGLRVVVLDRPSPLGGAQIEGPSLDTDLQSFVNHHPLPLRHGLTMGELARLLDSELSLGLGERLVVVRADGWTRADTLLDVGGRWVPPSPNLPDAESVLLYPAIALIEGTELSVGRGTSEPFRIFGAPWMNAERVLALLEAAHVPGVAFETTTFTPRSATQARRACRGIRVRLEDRVEYRAATTGLAIVRALHAVHADRLAHDRLLPLVGSERVLTALESGASLDALVTLAREDAAAFETRRAPFLLYR